MQKVFITTWLMVTIGACGGDRGHSSEESVETPSAPAGLEENPSAGSEEPGNGGLCLGECNPPQEVVLNFASLVSISPVGCTVGDVRVFDIGSGFIGFTLANCDGGNQVYSSLLSYAGVAVGEPVRVSQTCFDGMGTVLSFKADRGKSGLMVVAVCSTLQGSVAFQAIPVDGVGQPGGGSVVLTETVSSNRFPSPYELAWNEGAQVYGFAVTGKFVRLDEKGLKIGGTIAVPSTTSLALLESINGVWVYTQGFKTMTDSSQRGYCSKISSVGTLQCDQMVLDKDYSYGQRLLVDGRKMVTTRSDGSLEVASFDPQTCTLGGARSMGHLNEKRISHIFDAQSYGRSYIAVAYKAVDGGLQVAFGDTLTPQVVSTSAVMDGQSFGGAQILIGPEALYIAAVRDNDAVLAVAAIP